MEEDSKGVKDMRVEKGVKVVILEKDWKRFRVLLLQQGKNISDVVGKLILDYVERKGV